VRYGGEPLRAIVRFAGLLVALILLVPQTASGATFSVEVAVPMPPEFISAFGIDLAVASGEVRIMWSGQLQSSFGFDWAYAVSHTGGANFTAFRSPFPNAMSFFGENRVLAFPDRTFGYLWNEQGGTLRIVVERPGGSFAGPFAPLSGTPIGSDFDALAVGSDLFITWSDTSNGMGELRIGRFSGPYFQLTSWQTIDNDPAPVKVEPRIATSVNETLVVWRRSNPNGSSIMFSHGRLGDPWPSPVSPSGGGGPSEFHPHLAVHANGTALVAFDDFSGTGFSVTGAFGVPPYASFSRFNLGAAVGGLLPTDVDLATDDQGRLLVSWLDGDPQTQTGGFRVMYADSDDWATFSLPLRLDRDPTVASKDGPLLRSRDGRVFVAWGDRRTGIGTPQPYLASGHAHPAKPPDLAPLFIILGFIAAVAVFAIAFILVRRRRVTQQDIRQAAP